jgi:hypothetical protein
VLSDSPVTSGQNECLGSGDHKEDPGHSGSSHSGARAHREAAQPSARPVHPGHRQVGDQEHRLHEGPVQERRARLGLHQGVN